jgi:predicted deacylase
VIGYSVQKRPLEVYRFGTGPTEKLIVAGMHGGNEYNTVELADQLIAYIQANPGVIPADVTLYILHDLNPDGVAKEHGPFGRANAHGVDLNRNWPANWQKDWPRVGCWLAPPVTGGTGPASEPETKALMAFIQAHDIQAIINYHSAALGIFPGGIPIAANSKLLAQAIAAVTKYPYPPINTGCDYTGGFVDWTSNLGIASLDVELTNHTDTDFDKNLLALNVFLNWKQ